MEKGWKELFPGQRIFFLREKGKEVNFNSGLKRLVGVEVDGSLVFRKENV